MLFFAGEMGGYLGLLLGASWLTLCEVLDLFVYNVALRCVGDGKRKKISPARGINDDVMIVQNLE